MVLIAQISDLHLRPSGVPAYRVSETNMFAERAIDRLQTLGVPLDAVLVTGDVVDGWLDVEYEHARRLLERLAVPVYLLSGNHDDSARLKRTFAGWPGIDQGKPDRLYYAADIGPVRLVVLDSSVPGAHHGDLDADQLAFLDAELAACKGRPAVVAFHHPPVATGMVRMDNGRLRAADALAAILRRHDHVERVLCGHLHRGIVSRFAGTTVMVAPSTAHQLELGLDGRFAFNFEPPGFLLHRYEPGEGMASHTVYVERFAGPYPFFPDKGFGWSHPI